MLERDKMKVAIVSNFDLVSGRGPVFRLINIIPFVAVKKDLFVISLQQPDEKSIEVFKKNEINYCVVNYETRGWFVQNKEELAHEIKCIIEKKGIDLCILGWEFWDVAVELHKALLQTMCKFSIVFHSIPFVDAIPFPQNYQDDIQKRINQETNKMIREYLIEHSQNAEEIIRNWNVISINETVSYYLETYFKDFSFYKAYPGYALDLDNIEKIEKGKASYDFAFMSKLETSKGIFDLIEIISLIRRHRSTSRFLIIGDFLYEEERIKALSLIEKNNLKDAITFAGWLNGDEKYRQLKKAKVFLYPSLTGDTFSFCMLEALACGLDAVCYDTPFARFVYHNAPVKRIEYRNFESFAKAAIEKLDSYNEMMFNAATKFVQENYSSWELVAQAEEMVYEQIWDN